MLKDSVPDIYNIFYPASPLPLVFDSPHSGRVYPRDFQYACSRALLEQAEDNYVDDLFSCAPSYGGTLLSALFPRTYIDVNRSESDIDPALLEEDWPAPLKTTSRSHAGIGLIRRLLRPGIPVYNRKLRIHEVRQRIDKYYKPYHEALRSLIDDVHYHYGQVWHINCHSMPSSLTNFSLTGQDTAIRQPDFVIGTRDGTSCSAEFSDFLQSTLENMKYSVAMNDPYKGVELVRRYSRPSAGKHSLQIEINKALYWDEKNGRKNHNYNILKSDIKSLIQSCAAFVESRLVNLAAD